MLRGVIVRAPYFIKVEAATSRYMAFRGIVADTTRAAVWGSADRTGSTFKLLVREMTGTGETVGFMGEVLSDLNASTSGMSQHLTFQEHDLIFQRGGHQRKLVLIVLQFASPCFKVVCPFLLFLSAF